MSSRLQSMCFVPSARSLAFWAEYQAERDRIAAIKADEGIDTSDIPEATAADFARMELRQGFNMGGPCRRCGWSHPGKTCAEDRTERGNAQDRVAADIIRAAERHPGWTKP